VISRSAGHLSSRSGRGGEQCPWLIVVQPGKTVDLYVIDFSLTARYHDLTASDEHLPQTAADDDDEYCHVYATVRELPPTQGQPSYGPSLFCTGLEADPSLSSVPSRPPSSP